MDAMMPAIPPHLEKLHHDFFTAGTLMFTAVFGIALAAAILGLLCLILIAAPNLTQKWSGALRERHLTCFLVGIPIFVLPVLIFARRPSPIPLLVFVLLLLPAWAVAAEDIGRRLFQLCGREGSRVAHLAAGWGVFAFGALVPFLGWFLILPCVSMSALGSMVVSLFPARPAPLPTPPVTAPDV